MLVVPTGWITAKQEKRGAACAAISQQSNARLHSRVFLHEQELQFLSEKLLHHRFISAFDFDPIGENSRRLKMAGGSLAGSRKQQPYGLRGVSVVGSQFLEGRQPMRCRTELIFALSQKFKVAGSLRLQGCQRSREIGYLLLAFCQLPCFGLLLLIGGHLLLRQAPPQSRCFVALLIQSSQL